MKIVMLSVDELISEISGKTGKAEEEIRKLIKDKQTELSDLVSEEGAAYIVGRELGVELIKETKRDLKIVNIVPDMRNVDVVARVASVFDVREFNKNGKTGRVSSIILSDDSGTIRFPLWNDEVGLIASTGLKRGDKIEVTGAWAKKDNYRDGVELRLGKRGKIKVVEQGDDPGPDEDEVVHNSTEGQPQQAAQRVEIKAAQPGMSVIVRGCIVQVYRKRPYFETCPQCNGKLEEKEGGLGCKEHGIVKPMSNLLLTGVVDDGTANIRVVFFREQAEKLFGKGAEEVRKEFNEIGHDDFWDKFPATGKEIMIEGRVKTNDLSKEPEIVANSVSDVDVKGECHALLAKVGS